MRHDDRTLRQLRDRAGNAPAVAQIKQCRRLIEHDVARLHRENAGDGQHLLLAATEQMRRLIAAGRQPVARQHGVDPSRQFGAWQMQAAEAEREIFLDHRHHDLVVRVLKHEAHAAAHLSALAPCIQTIHLDGAFGRDLQTVEQAGERAFA